MNEITRTVLLTGRRLVQELQEFPVELLERQIAEGTLELQLPECPRSGPLRELLEDNLKAMRLLLQWSNQAREQLALPTEARELSKRGAEHLVSELLKRAMP